MLTSEVLIQTLETPPEQKSDIAKTRPDPSGSGRVTSLTELMAVEAGNFSMDRKTQSRYPTKSTTWLRKVLGSGPVGFLDIRGDLCPPVDVWTYMMMNHQTRDFKLTDRFSNLSIH